MIFLSVPSLINRPTVSVVKENSKNKIALRKKYIKFSFRPVT